MKRPPWVLGSSPASIFVASGSFENTTKTERKHEKHDEKTRAEKWRRSGESVPLRLCSKPTYEQTWKSR